MFQYSRKIRRQKWREMWSEVNYPQFWEQKDIMGMVFYNLMHGGLFRYVKIWWILRLYRKKVEILRRTHT